MGKNLFHEMVLNSLLQHGLLKSFLHLLLMENFAASSPPEIEYTGVPPSTSDEVTVITAVVFSATLALAALVTVGASLTAVTAIDTTAGALVIPVPSETVRLMLRVAVLGFSLVLR